MRVLARLAPGSGPCGPRRGNRVRRFPGPALSGSGASWVRGSGAESSESGTIQTTPKRSSGIPRAGNDLEAAEPTLKAGNDPRAGNYLVGRESPRPNTKASGENSPDPTSGPAVILPPIQHLDKRRESPRPKTKTSGENSPSQRMPPGRQTQQALNCRWPTAWPLPGPAVGRSSMRSPAASRSLSRSRGLARDGNINSLVGLVFPHGFHVESVG